MPLKPLSGNIHSVMTMAKDRPMPIPVQRALRTLGDDLLTWRKLRQLTAAQVADRAGISRPTLRKLERGEGSISLENALRVARALGVVDKLSSALDPYSTDVGRLRTEERLPQRVRRTRTERDG